MKIEYLVARPIFKGDTMKIKQNLNTVWLVLFACATLAFVHCAKRDDPGSEPISDEAAVMQSKESLKIVYAEGDSESSVTRDITLPTAGAGEVVITWESSHSEIIAISETDDEDGNRMGVVTRPESGENNAEVTLTATLTKNEALDTKTFALTVLPEPVSDDDTVMRAIANLAITYAGTDTAMSVAGNVTLPTAGSDGVMISWMSSDTSIISTAGVVTRPDDMDMDVTLTATLTKNAATGTKSFTLTVIISDAGADTAAVANANNALAIGYSGTDTIRSVTEDVTLPTAGSDGVMISWESLDTSIISDSGVVTRPDDMDTDVTLIATLTKNAATGTKSFTLTVIISDAGAITQAINNLAITYSGTDTTMSVTEDVTLPATGANGVVISWASSDTAIISTAGVVTRPDDMDTNVTLLATLTKNAAMERRLFTLTVIISDAGADTAAVANANNALAIGYSGTDTIRSVTEDVTLPTAGSDGVMISWESVDASIISDSGVVTRPDDMDTNVTLIATLTKNAAMDRRLFTLTVIISDAGADTIAVTNAKNALEIIYSGTDTARRVTGDVTLPATGANGVVITWMSSDTSIISTAGVVTRPDDMDTDVTLTATLTKNAAMGTKEFTPTVIISADGKAVQDAKTDLAIGYSGTDNATGVTANIKLPTAGANGVGITWAETTDSDNSIAIAETADGDGNLLGTITRPSSTNTMVTLTATLAKGSVTQTKEFMLTVLAPPATMRLPLCGQKKDSRSLIVLVTAIPV